MKPAPPPMSPDWSGAADKGPNGTEVVTCQQLADERAPYAFAINSEALLDADDVTGPGKFPKFGQFLSGIDADGGAVYVEACHDLKVWLDLNDAEAGDEIRITGCRKDDGTGRWKVGVERVEERP